MASPARKPATYDDLLKLPDDQIGEIVNEDLYASPRPAGRHASRAFTLRPAERPLEAIEPDLLRLWSEDPSEDRPTPAG